MLEDVTAKGLVVTFPINGAGSTVWCSDFIASLIWLSSVYATPFVFRGHSDTSFDLQGRLARVVIAEQANPSYSHLLARERSILDDVEEAGWLSDARSNPLAQLASLQHRGVPTRLLDLTLDPLVATWFAVEKDAGVDGAVILIRDIGARAKMTKAGDLRFTPAGSTYAVWAAPPIDNRIISQRGAFLVVNGLVAGVQPSLISAYGIAKFNPRGSWKGAGIQKTVDNYLNGQYRGRPKKYPPNLVMFLIPSGMKRPMARMLSAFGLSKRNVYPDLEGYASSFLA